MPKLVSIHAESTGVTELLEVRPVLDGLRAGRGPMSAATAGSVCLSEIDCSSEHRLVTAPQARLLHRLPSLNGVVPQAL